MLLKSVDVNHLPFYTEVVMLFVVSILNFSDSKFLFNELRSRIDLHWLLGFGTKKSLLKKARDV